MAGLSCGDGRYWPRSRSRASRMAPCLQGQYRQSAQVRVTWQLDAPDSRTMLTPGRSLSSLASLQPRRLSGDFDAALPLLWQRAMPGSYAGAILAVVLALLATVWA